MHSLSQHSRIQYFWQKEPFVSQVRDRGSLVSQLDVAQLSKTLASSRSESGKSQARMT